ncbi:ABC transporter ATP-binding protein/permease [Bacteroidia bacterium]|nr:ABC transporter ATP-binding protein/permease [Bacteroidia bacterium]
MKSVFQFLQYAKNYKGWIAGNVVFNLLYVLLNLTTLLLIMPVLRFLFSEDPSQIEISDQKKQLGGKFVEWYESFMQWFAEMAKGDVSKALLFLCVGLIIVTILKNAARYTAMNFMILIRNYSIRNLRKEIYDKSLKLPISYFNEERKGDLLSRMSNDMKEIEFALMVSLEALYFQPLNIIIFLIALVVLAPKLTLMVLLFLPVTALIIGIVGRSLRKKSGVNQMLAGKILSTFEETLGGMRIIKGFTAEKRFSKKYDEIDMDYTKNNIGVQRRYDLSSPLSETIALSISAVLLWFGGRMVFNGDLNPEFFLTYFAIFSQLIPPFKGFSSALYASEKGMASVNRIKELVEAPIVVEDHPNPKSISFKDTIELNQVSFGYTETQVVRNFNTTIKKGHTIALVGSSGSGKTTVADLVARFYDVTEGAILIDGINIKDFSQQDLRGITGIVSQESILFNDTIENNLRVGKPEASLEEIENACKAANAHEFILQTENGYQSMVGERGGKLSGGQKQRLSIARALLKDPEILILDEATSALDSESEKAVQGALEKLMENRTSIVIAHRLSTITHANTIIVMDKGEISETGTHQELLKTDGIYAKLIKLQTLN